MTTSNSLKVAALLAALTALLVFIGQLIGGNGGMVFAFGLSLLMNMGAYWFSDRIALRMSGAREVSPRDAPDLHRLVEQLTAFARMPKPRVYVIDNPSPNAFATGRDPNHAAVAVTTGILRILSTQELAGVLAHELAHVKNRDTLIASLAATMAGAITMIASMARWAMIFGGFRGDDEEGGGGNLLSGLVMIIVAPIAAVLIQLAISRSREYEADATGARIVGEPLALASALEKLEATVRVRPMEVNPSTAHLFIVNPFSGGGLASLFSTHPPVAERVARLRQMSMTPTRFGLF